MTTYYIAPAPLGSDVASGTATAPFASLTKAVNTALAGDTIIVKSGSYQKTTSTYADGKDHLTIKAEDNSNPPYFKCASGINGIKASNCDYFTLDGLWFQGDALNVTLAYALAQKDNLNNPITYIYGVELRNSHHVTISGNIFTDFPGNGIVGLECDYVTISRNVVKGCAFYSPFGVQGIALGWGLAYDTAPGYHNVIQYNASIGNRCLVPWYVTGLKSEGNGIMVDTLYESKAKVPYLASTLIQGNYAALNGGAGFQVFQANNVSLYANTSENNCVLIKDYGELQINRVQNVFVSDTNVITQPDRKWLFAGTSTNLNIQYARVKGTILVDNPNKVALKRVDYLGAATS